MNDDRKNTSKNVNKFIQKLYTKIKSEAACTVCAEKNVRTDVQGGGAERERAREEETSELGAKQIHFFRKCIQCRGDIRSGNESDSHNTHTHTHPQAHTCTRS